MKALFRIDRITPQLGCSIVSFTHTPTADDDFKGNGGFPITLFDTNAIAKLRTGDTYQLEITNVNDLPAATSEDTPETAAPNEPATGTETTEQLTENNNNLKNTDMSIFTRFGDFIAALVDKVKKLWAELDPVIKADTNAVLSASSILLSNLQNPASVILGLFNSILGTMATTKITDVLSNVVTDLGLGEQALNATTPEAFLQVIIDDFSKSTGNNLLDKVEAFEKYVSLYLNPDQMDRTTAGQIAQYAKAHFFTAPAQVAA